MLDKQRTQIGNEGETWMVAGDRIVDDVAKEPSRKLVIEWLIDVYINLPGQTVRNAWMKKGFE